MIFLTMGTSFECFVVLVVSLRACPSRIMFDNSPDINVQSRANSIRTGIPNAIFRAAVQSPGGLQGAYDVPDGFLGFTSKIYVRHPSS